MKKTRRQLTAFAVSGFLAISLLNGCSGSGSSGSAGSDPAVSAETEAENETVTAVEADHSGKVTGSDEEVTAGLADGGSMTVTYQAEDLDDSWDPGMATSIVCDGDRIQVEGSGADAEGSTVTISRAGTYVVSGILSDGQVLVDAGKEDVVRIVLNGADLSNSRTSPVYGRQSGKIILTLAAGTENRVSDAAEYVYDNAGDDEPNAAVFSKDDLVINGSGGLTVAGNYECGIRSKDDLTIISGRFDIEALSDGLKGKDSVMIKDGDFQIKAGKDGIKSNNDTDAEKGYIWIDGGVYQITADDDGIQAETKVVVNGGQITIADCQEGIAGLTVDINDGNIDITAQDDGMNAAAAVATEREKMMDQDGVYLRIAGGEVTIDASGDGLDSNGDLYIEGGTIYMSGSGSGSEGMFDYNGTSLLTGGSIFAAGNAGMMQTFGSDSTQSYLVVYLENSHEAGTDLFLTDEEDTELLRFTPAKGFNTLIISVPELEEGRRYRVTAGDEIAELTVAGRETVSGNAQGGRGQGGGFGGRPQGNLPDNEAMPPTDGKMTLPDGVEGGTEHPPEGGMPEAGMPGAGMPGAGRGPGGDRAGREASSETAQEAETTAAE